MRTTRVPAKVLLALGVLALVAVAPVGAHHRQTPAALQITYAGDNEWPRLAALGDRLVFARRVPPQGRQIFQRQRDRRSYLQITYAGDNANPTAALGRDVIAWDSDADFLFSGDPGRQVFVRRNGLLAQVTHDPTGTSTNPSLNGPGTRVAYESQGQIFVWSLDGRSPPTRISTGTGVARNPVYGRGGSRLAFESTTDPLTGSDSGVWQIWLLLPGSPAVPITRGSGPSRLPALSPVGRLVAFESQADLAGDGADTGTSQIFVYDILDRSYLQITQEASGCSTPSINDMVSGVRVSYVCGGRGYYRLVASGEVYELLAAGDTRQVVNAGGSYFVQVSTTANLLGGGAYPGHQLYQLNLFRLRGTPVPAPPIRRFR
jgi:hypothetical protein